ncbi:hypothetical protein LCGC14_1931290, partial [marine sediment metagenome]
MQAIDERGMMVRLEDIPEGSTAFVSYVAGRKAKPRAVAEAERHTRGQPRRYFFGQVSSVWQNRFGEWCMTLFAENRDTIRDGVRFKGGYRTFNPSLGSLIVLELI